MSQKIEKSKRPKKKRILIVISSFFIVYLLMSSIPLIFGNFQKTILPDTGILYKKVEGQGVVIKDEIVYNADGSGQLNLAITEGERIPVGVEVASISLLQDTSRLKQELVEINQRIETLSKSDKSASKKEDDKSKVDSEKLDLIENIQKNISSKSFSDIQSEKEELKLYDDTIQVNTLLGQGIDALKQQRLILENQINSNNIRYYSKRSGIVSYHIDGYENIYRPLEFENYTFDNIIISDIVEQKSEQDEITTGKPVFKIINNFEWYMAIKVEDRSQVEQYEIGQPLVFELDNGTELNGKIIMLNISNNNVVIVLKLNTYLHEDYNLRFTPISIINYKKEGLKIPTDVIIEKDGKKGVYIKEIYGIVKFRQIDILGVEDDYTFINKGDNNGYILFEGDEKPKKTITLHDEIFIDPAGVTEGEILK